MASKFSFGSVQLDVSPGAQREARRRDPERPFVIGVLGDFSGRAARGVMEPLAVRAARKLDVDNAGVVLRKLGARLRLSVGETAANPAELGFETLEDFHPDRLLARVPLLASLLQQRKQVPPTVGRAGAAVRVGDPATASAAENRAAESNTDTMARLLGKAPAGPAAPASSRPSGVESLIRDIVTPHLVAGPTPGQTAAVSAADLELTAALRGLLHHADFQALESTWRGLDLLVRDYGAEEKIKLVVADVSRAELMADLHAADELGNCGLAGFLRAQAENEPWVVIVGAYAFGAAVSEISSLGRLAKIAARTGAPFLAAADSSLVGCDAFSAHPDPDDWSQPPAAEAGEAWSALRELPEAAYLGLALPRFLLRQPYGRDCEPIEAFPFEEMESEPAHEAYLWGNPAFACGHLLAGAFLAEGWDMPGCGYGELSELPVHRFKQNDETRVKPCAEAWLSERAGEAILSAGLMPLLSVKGRDAVRIQNLQSVAGTALRFG